MKKKIGMKVMALTVAGVMLVGGLVGCDKTKDDKKEDKTTATSEADLEDGGFLDNKNASEVEVLKVGDQKVYLDELNLYGLQYAYTFGLTEENLLSLYSETQTNDAYNKEQLLTQIRQAKIEYQTAKEKGIELTDEESEAIETGVTNFMNSMDAGMLEYFGITEDTVRKSFTEQMYNTALEGSVKHTGDSSDYQCNTIYYLTFLTVQMEGESVVNDADGNPVALDDAAKAKMKEKADAALVELQNGAEPADVAKKYEVTVSSGEESNIIGAYPDEFDAVMVGMKDGEISEVFETEYGYNIVKMITADDKEFAEYFNTYYNSQLDDTALKEEQQKWYASVKIDAEKDLVGDTWERFSLLPYTVWFDNLGITPLVASTEAGSGVAPATSTEK